MDKPEHAERYKTKSAFEHKKSFPTFIQVKNGASNFQPHADAGQRHGTNPVLSREAMNKDLSFTSMGLSRGAMDGMDASEIASNQFQRLHVHS